MTVGASVTGTLTNTATVSGDQADPNLANNTSTVVTTVNSQSDLTILKTASPNPVGAGSNLTYMLTVTNNGPSTATGVTITDPLPVGDERPTGPVVLRLRRTDRIPEERDTENGFMPAIQPEQPSELSAVTAELCEVRPGGALNEVLRGVRPVFADSPAARAALPELLGEGGELIVPAGQRAILAPLRGRRRVIGAALFLRRPERMAHNVYELVASLRRIESLPGAFRNYPANRVRALSSRCGASITISSLKARDGAPAARVSGISERRVDFQEEQR